MSPSDSLPSNSDSSSGRICFTAMARQASIPDFKSFVATPRHAACSASRRWRRSFASVLVRLGVGIISLFCVSTHGLTAGGPGGGGLPGHDVICVSVQPEPSGRAIGPVIHLGNRGPAVVSRVDWLARSGCSDQVRRVDLAGSVAHHRVDFSSLACHRSSSFRRRPSDRGHAGLTRGRRGERVVRWTGSRRDPARGRPG